MKRVFSIVIFLLLGFAVAPFATAALITVTIEGIPGNNTAVGQEGSIAAIAASIDFQSSATATTGGGGGAGKTTAGPLGITKNLDSASPRLFLAVATGTRFPTAVLRFYTAQGQHFYTITLTDVVIIGVATANDAANSSVVETVKFAYGAIRMKDELNNVETGFDFGSNRQL